MKRHEHWSTWYQGSRSDWDRLPMPEREDLAFKATGCEVAYPTWTVPVDCLHVDCRVRRGELPRIARVNSTLRAEGESGWLRFCDRDRKAKIYREIRRQAKASGSYDAWKSWPIIVYGGILA